MMILMGVEKAQRGLSRYGLAAILILAAAVWPQHSDASLVGAGILVGLSMAVRGNARAPGRTSSQRNEPVESLATTPCFAINRTKAKLPPRHRAWRNELTGELFERSRMRIALPSGRKRAIRYRSSDRTPGGRKLQPLLDRG